MVRRKVRILCSPTTAIVSIIAAFGLCGFYVLSLNVDGGRKAFLGNIPLLILWTLTTCGMSIALVLVGSKRIFSIITIDETGVSRAFLGIFWKLQISWDEMAEICYKEHGWAFLFFSKTQNISELTYNKAIAVKDAIQISFSQRRYAVIEQYLLQPIVGMPDKVKERLSRNKH